MKTWIMIVSGGAEYAPFFLFRGIYKKIQEFMMG